MFLRDFGTFWKCSQTLLRFGAALLVMESFPARGLVIFAICSLMVTGGLPPRLTGQEQPVVVDSEQSEAGERWFLIDSATGTIGHAVLRWQQTDAQHDGSQEMQLRMNRFGDVVTQHVKLLSVEDESGRLLRFESSVSDGQQEQKVAGTRRDDGLEVTTTIGEDRRSRTIERVGDCRGFFAMERSLEQRPMSVGERRQIRCLVPLVTQVATTSLVAKGWETTPLRSGSRRLLRIDGTVQLDPQTKIDFIIWTDRAGVVIKNYVPSIEQTTYLSNQDEATSTEDIDTCDIKALASVPATGLSGDPHAAEFAVYRFRSQTEGVTPADLFPIGGSQRVTMRPDGAIDVRVSRVRPSAGSQPAVPAEAGGHVPDDLAANQLIDSDAPEIIALSRLVSTERSEQWQIALALERLVFDTITAKNYSRTFASASSAARTRAGDCTEHAVLLAALCRARGIPARFVAGLVHLPGQEAFGMHAWTEVWIGDHWIGLDATMARGGLGAGHIKICDSNLAGANPAAATLPVSQLLGKALTIECLELGAD